MVYGSDVMLPIEINTPIWRREHFDNESNKTRLKSFSNLIEDVIKWREFKSLQQSTEQYGDIILRWIP